MHARSEMGVIGERIGRPVHSGLGRCGVTMDDELGAFFEEISAIDPTAVPAAARPPPTTSAAAAAAKAKPTKGADAALPHSRAPPPTSSAAAAAAVPAVQQDTAPKSEAVAPIPAQLLPPQSASVFDKAKVSRAPREPVLRGAAGEKWKDATLADWPDDDFRIFVGNIGNDVTDDLLTKSFQHYSTFNRARVVRDKRSEKSRGYGFVSFSDSKEYVRAMSEMQGKYCGNRPMKLSKAQTHAYDDVEAMARRDAKRQAQGGGGGRGVPPNKRPRAKKNWWD